MMRSLSCSHVPDSIGAGALAPCATHIRQDTQPPLFRLPSNVHDIHNIDIAHKLRRTFFLKQFSYIYSYAVDSLNSSTNFRYTGKSYPKIFLAPYAIFITKMHQASTIQDSFSTKDLRIPKKQWLVFTARLMSLQ